MALKKKLIKIMEQQVNNSVTHVTLQLRSRISFPSTLKSAQITILSSHRTGVGVFSESRKQALKRYEEEFSYTFLIQYM